MTATDLTGKRASHRELHFSLSNWSVAIGDPRCHAAILMRLGFGDAVSVSQCGRCMVMVYIQWAVF